jgi:hypothetical protein
VAVGSTAVGVLAVGTVVAGVGVGAGPAVAVLALVRAGVVARRVSMASPAVKGRVDFAGLRRAGRAARWVSAVAVGMCNLERPGLAVRRVVQGWRLRSRNLHPLHPLQSMAELAVGMPRRVVAGIVGRRSGVATAVKRVSGA